MNAAITIVVLGVILLACSSLAFLVVRLASPKLLGTAWLSGAFAAGALGSSLLLVRSIPWVCTACADTGLLLSFVLLHVAVLRLLQRSTVSFWHGGALVGLHFLVDALVLQHTVGMRVRIASLCVLIAVQCFATSLVVWRSARPQVRASAIFSAVLLTAFGCLNLLRSAAVLFVAGHQTLILQLFVVAFSSYIAVTLGLAFGFFWMTTSALAAELEHMASTDPLTRLYNRRVFLRWCERELLRSQRSGMPFSVLMIDLDYFKRVNDDFGHQTGDEVLCAAVEKMQDSIRGIDVLCRWGGEEFAVLLPNAPIEATRIVAERIRANIQKVTLSSARTSSPANHAFQLSVSIGAATYRDIEDGLAAMLHRADKALYCAKESGRNRVLVAS